MKTLRDSTISIGLALLVGACAIESEPAQQSGSGGMSSGGTTGGTSAGATGESYTAAFERARTYLAHLSASDQAQILGGTAARLFKLGA